MSTIVYLPLPKAIVVPDVKVDESVWVEACTAALAAVQGGRSLAFSTDNFVDLDKAVDIEGRAFAKMTQLQQAKYKAWQVGDLKLAEWNWKKTAEVGKLSDKTKNAWKAKAAALARIYGCGEVTAAQAKAWVLNNWPLHPLWKAVLHVITTERAACGGHDDVDPKAFVEGIACRRFLRLLAMHTYKKTYEAGKETDVFEKARVAIERRLKVVEAEIKA